MSTEDSHQDIADLLSAFALDALRPKEAASVAGHLRSCVRCSGEVDEFRELASVLASAGDDPPAYLWARIASVVGA